MPTLEFKGKPFVYSHHLSVPFRELIVEKGKSLPPKGEEPNLDDNLIIHGDNLEALKALLPRYAGKIDVIYIDPPYNTGNEGWAYNDNVNSPLMKEWLGKTVDAEDLERHDKWLCMMWPRLQLLRELLADHGTIWVSMNDIEAARLKIILDDVFGPDNFVADCIWQKRFSPSNDAKFLSETHDHILAYAKDKASWQRGLLPRSEKNNSIYGNPDNDSRGDWTADNYVSNKNKEERPNGWYPIKQPNTGKEIWPSPTAVWRYVADQHERNVADNRVWWGKTGRNSVPRYKRFKSEVPEGVVPQTLWLHSEVGHNQGAKQLLKQIFPEIEDLFFTPKPATLIERVIRIAGIEDAVVLDSFAGSGTTAHAVLALNHADGGNRKFILVETEDYADTLTAERVRRVIKGAPKAKDETLKAGLGGSFTYCELGEAMDLERFFDEEQPPAYEQVARYVAYTATGHSLA
jgi:adenine-specific DNA-methyltransferase